MRVLGISGSLRRDSYNTQLLRAAEELLPPGVELQIVPPELLKAVPPYDADDDPTDDRAVAGLRELLADADAVLVSTPEYNSSLPGQLKNALDWVSRPIATNPLRNKPVTVLGASTGMFGAVWAQQEARKVLGALGARVVGEAVPFPRAQEGFDEAGAIADADVEAAVASALDDLVEAVEARARAA